MTTQPHPTLEWHSESFLRHISLANYAHNTIRTYESTLNNFIDWASKNNIQEFKNISGPSLSTWLTSNNWAPSTAKIYLSHISAFIEWAKENNLCADGLSPTKKARKYIPPHTNKIVRYFTRKEIRAIKKDLAPEPFFHDLFVVGINTGLRIMEMLTLTTGDIDLKEGWIKIRPKQTSFGYWTPKRNKSRVVPFNTRSAVHERFARRAWAPAVMPIFPSPQGNFYPQSKKTFALRLKRSVPDSSPHTTRHTFATHWLEAGFSIYRLQAILGHDCILTTMKYLHTSPEGVKKDMDQFAI